MNVCVVPSETQMQVRAAKVFGEQCKGLRHKLMPKPYALQTTVPRKILLDRTAIHYSSASACSTWSLSNT
jgi:hypothetical protein